MRAFCLPPNRRTDHDVPIDDDLTPDLTARELERARDGALVARQRTGDPDAFGELYDIWFDRVFNVALRIVCDQEIAAEVTQDAFASAWRNLDGLDDPASFGGWLLRIGRNAALNRAEREARSTSIDQDGLAMIEQHGGSPTSAPPGFDIGAHLEHFDDPAAAVGDAQIVALVREAAAALGPRDAEVLDLQLRYQLTPAEVGQVLDLNRNAANQLCHRVRARFAGAFGARMLWGNGQPKCAALQAELTAAGVDRFGTDAVPLISRHADECLTCGEDRRTRLSPAALFASIPLVPALLSVRSGVAHGLAATGVPMQGSQVAPTLPGGGAPTPPPTTATQAVTPRSASPIVGLPGETPPSALRSSRQVVLAAVGIAAVVVLVTAFLLTRGDDGSARRVASGPDSTAAALARRASTGSTTTTRDLGTATSRPGDTTPPVVVHPTTPTGPTPPTTSPTAPTTTIPPVTVDQFAVAPDTPQPAVYAVATGPVLTWSVSHAADVTIWVWFDDGVHGDQRVGIVATGTSGSRPLCPGSHPTPESCTAASGHYRYELVATAEDGSNFTDPRSPGFDVLQPVIT
jgi:RNA polymerase sigma factor (sigma-70 family)